MVNPLPSIASYYDPVKSLSLVVWLAAIPAFGKLGPFIEVPVTGPTMARAAGTQYLPHVATDGRDFFAVWFDSRGGSTAVFGTRVLADGTVLDPTGILIATPSGSCDSPGLVWDGANYVVVWKETISRPYFFASVSFVRVDRNGRVLGDPKTLIDSYYTGSPSIASDGHGSMVIFSKPVGRVALISQDGSVTEKVPLPQVVGRVTQIASNGDGYLLSWTDTKTSLIRLDTKGDVVAGSALQLTERGDYTQLIAGIGGPYLLVGRKWDGENNSCSRTIVGRIVTSSGVSNPFVIHDAGGLDIGDIAVTPDPNGFQVVWMKRLGAFPCSALTHTDPPTGPYLPYPPFGLAQVHVGQDGISGRPVVVSEGTGLDQRPSVARNGAAELLVWIQTGYWGRPSKLAAAIAHPGEAMLQIPIAWSAARQDYSSIAAAEGMFMTAWREEDPLDERTAIYARRFSGDGRALDAAAIKVSADYHASNVAPKVSFDGAVWLFLWYGDYKVVARRMTVDGKWIDAAPFAIGGPPYAGFDYAIASNGNGFAVITITYGPTLTMVSIPRAGDVHLLPVAMNFGLTRYVTSPAMAWDGKAYVAVWARAYYDGIEGIRLDQDGHVITPLFTMAGDSQLNGLPSIACHEGACAVAWESGDSIAAARVIGGAVVPLNIKIVPADPNTYADYPTVLAIRDGFQLFWNERGSPTPSLFTASMTAAGIDSPSLLGTAGPYGPAAPAITTRGQPALALFRPANDPAYGGAMRAFLRVFASEPRRRAVGR